MKTFTFPLARVLDWRTMQARIEESKLEALYAERRAIDSAAADLDRQQAESAHALLKAGMATSTELAALDGFRRFTTAEKARLQARREDCGRRIDQQIEAVKSRRRDVRLLEHLRDRREEIWTHELQRELDAQAGESYLAKWNQRPRPSGRGRAT